MDFTKILRLAVPGACCLLFALPVGNAADAPATPAPPVAAKPATPAAAATPMPATPATSAKQTGKTTPVAQPAFSAPFVTAKTNFVSSKTVNSPAASVLGVTIGQSQAQRETSVGVNVRFFTPPPGMFEVQCFFLAKNDSTKARYIFNTVTHSSKGPNTELEFLSGPLTGATTNWIGIPSLGTISGLTNNTNPAEAAAAGLGTNTDAKNASKMEGWVVRVVYQGRVLKVDSNQPYLEQMAKNMPEVFDRAVGGK